MNHNFNKAVQEALRHVNAKFPTVTQVFFSNDGRWFYCDSEFKAPVFSNAIDISILEKAADAADNTKGFPCAFNLLTLQDYYKLWEDLGNKPVAQSYEDDPDTLQSAFLHFPVGTHREDIWHWFEDQHPEFIVGEVMQGIRRQDTEPPALSQFIKKVFTEHTGGGVMVDLIILADQRIVGVNDECAVLYKDMEAFYTESNQFFYFPEITNEANSKVMAKDRLSVFITRIDHEYTMDVVVLASGMVIGIDSEAVSLYQDLDVLNDGQNPIASINLNSEAA